jgi:hypothetical protein
MFVAFTALALAIQGQAPAATQSAAEDDPVICKRENAEVGTHMRPKAKCMKKSDWNLVEKQAQRELNRFHERNLDPGYSPPPR